MNTDIQGFRSSPLLDQFLVECHHIALNSHQPSRTLIAVESNAVAESAHFAAIYDDHVPFRIWEIVAGGITNRDGLEKEVFGQDWEDYGAGFAADTIGLTAFMDAAGSKVRLKCDYPECRTNSEITPIKFARTLDYLVSKCDPLGISQIPLSAVSKAIDRLCAAHRNDDPYWTDAHSVYSAIAQRVKAEGEAAAEAQRLWYLSNPSYGDGPPF